jgi:hypothetical protein
MTIVTKYSSTMDKQVNRLFNIHGPIGKVISLMYNSVSSCIIPSVSPTGNHSCIKVQLIGKHQSTTTAAIIDSHHRIVH